MHMYMNVHIYPTGIGTLLSRFQILQQMRGDTALLTKEEGGSPVRNPSTAAEDARLASLISLDGILKKVKVCKLHNVILLYQFLGAED